MPSCKNCGKLDKYIWLADDGFCFECSPQYTIMDYTKVFPLLVSSTQGPYSWEEWVVIATKVSQIDMGCEFANGGCTHRLAKDLRGCCSGCAACLGYLKAIPEEALFTVLSIFTPEYGFWGFDGCCLPWQYRSPVCLSYRCKKLRDVEDKNLWTPFYLAVGLGNKQCLPILNHLPRRKEC